MSKRSSQMIVIFIVCGFVNGCIQHLFNETTHAQWSNPYESDQERQFWSRVPSWWFLLTNLSVNLAMVEGDWFFFHLDRVWPAAAEIYPPVAAQHKLQRLLEALPGCTTQAIQRSFGPPASVSQDKHKWTYHDGYSEIELTISNDRCVRAVEVPPVNETY